MLNDIIITALLNTTIIICFKKWKWLDKYSMYRKQWMPKSDCYLCLGFWMSVITLPFFDYNLLIPFCSAPITNYLTNVAVIHDYNKN
jgi:hypothetical protein